MIKHKIYTKNDQSKIQLTSALRSVVKKAIVNVLEYQEIDFPVEISVTFTNNEKIKVLNAEYRQKDCDTDVLSFPLFENGEIEYDDESDEPCALGDIVISLEKAVTQSENFGHSLERETAFLAVHSVLHLLGFDHETSKEYEEYMNETCEEVLSQMGLHRIPDGKQQDKDRKTMFVSLIGRPNVGKSTLLNAIVGEKVASVSKKPQTTRTRITGIYTNGNEQYVFVDTPGIHKPKNKLGEFMVKAASSAIPDTDAVVFVTDVDSKVPLQDKEIIETIKKLDVPAILVINKTDITKKDKLLETMAVYSKLHDFVSIIPTSALNNENVDIVINELRPYLRNERWYYPEDMVTDQTVRSMTSEIIREKLLRILDDEIPHGIAVTVEEFTENKSLVKIRAEIYCEKEAHKKIIIGAGGATLKKAATFAREDLEKLTDKKVYLDLWVRVKENWRDSELNMARLGFKKDEK